MSATIKSRRFAGLAATLVAGTFLFAGCSEMLSRTDFSARVKDKSDTEVAKLVGKPAAVDEKPELVTWTYNSRTFNVDDHNKFDTKTVVVFKKISGGTKLVVSDVAFE